MKFNLKWLSFQVACAWLVLGLVLIGARWLAGVACLIVCAMSFWMEKETP